MGDKPSDNRRRISDNLLDEIEEFSGKDFSEKLLKWKNDSDELSIEISDQIDEFQIFDEAKSEEWMEKQFEKFQDKMSENGITVDDVEDAVSRAIERDLPEVLRREMR